VRHRIPIAIAAGALGLAAVAQLALAGTRPPPSEAGEFLFSGKFSGKDPGASGKSIELRVSGDGSQIFQASGSLPGICRTRFGKSPSGIPFSTVAKGFAISETGTFFIAQTVDGVKIRISGEFFGTTVRGRARMRERHSGLRCNGKRGFSAALTG
jgi:hypothetical protein